MMVRERLLAIGRTHLETAGELPMWVTWNVVLGAALQENPEDTMRAENIALEVYKDVLVEVHGEAVREYVEDAWRLMHILITGNEEALEHFPLERMIPWREKLGPAFPTDTVANAKSQKDHGTEI